MRPEFEIAALASSFVERWQIVEAFSTAGVAKASPDVLDKYTTWKIDKLAKKFASQRREELLLQGTTHRTANLPVDADIPQVLTDYELYLRHYARDTDSDPVGVMQLHTVWTSTYRAALDTLTHATSDYADAVWYKADVYFDRFGKACEPFLRLLHDRLRLLCVTIREAHPAIGIEPGIVAEFELHLLSRFDLMLAWALEADINVYCAANSIDKATADRAAYCTYLDKTFANAAAYHSFYCRFPVLGRWLAVATEFACTFACELLTRVVADSAELSATFFQRRPIVNVHALKFGNSDCHAGGKSVVFVDFQLVNGETATVVYKPRCLEVEAALQGLLRELPVEFETFQVLPRKGYGYAEYLQSGRTTVDTAAEVQRFYRQLGGYLAVFYILGGGDLHHQNILVLDGNAYICDSEMILGAVLQDTGAHLSTLADSVFRVGMLEWPRGESSNAVELGGYAGGESYEIPFTVPCVEEGSRGSLRLHVTSKSGLMYESSASNRIRYNGLVVEAKDYMESILAGFDNVYCWFNQNTEPAIELVNQLFGGSSIRFVNHGTQAYANLLTSARHPKCLAHPVEVDLVFGMLRKHRRIWDRGGEMAAAEQRAMSELDIPVFAVLAHSNELQHRQGKVLPVPLTLTPLENASRRIKLLSEENRARQNQYIRASLSIDEIDGEDFKNTATDYAMRIGHLLGEKHRPSSDQTPWKVPTIDGEDDIGVDLYQGAAGICLFLAYLNEIRPDRRIREMADRSLAWVLDKLQIRTVGVFTGDTGPIYLLTHLAALWNDRSLLDRAIQLAQQTRPLICQDQKYDVLCGVAGLIPVLLQIAQQTGGELLDIAIDCGRHLLAHAEVTNDTLSWTTVEPELAFENLSGFAHGTAGIGWALIRLGLHVEQREFIDAGRKAFAYEKRHFDETTQNWFDARTCVAPADPTKKHFTDAWCNGSAGIGLARLAAWTGLGQDDPGLLRECRMAVSAVMNSMPQIGNDTLCHGRSGNCELLLRYALLVDEPSFRMEANVQAYSQWRHLDREGRMAGQGTDVEFPGLMIGLAGTGLHYLRLAWPHRVPSPLLLDPPVRWSTH